MNILPLNSSFSPSPARRYSFMKVFTASSFVAALLFTPAFANEVSDVSRLLRSEQHSEALSKANAFLSKHPRDAQMRFLKGVILTEQNKAADAIDIFTRLTKDFPELPEPYNNLAVLYAADGQFEKARSALDKAIRTNPAYATAYENLGDVHAKLASQAYDKAFQLDSKNSEAKSKLTLVRSLVDAGGKGVQVAATAPAKAAPASAGLIASAERKKAAAPVAAAKPVQIATAKPNAGKSDPKPTQKQPGNNETEDTAILAMVDGWAKAWSEQDVKDYLGYYSKDFDTPKGMSRKAWIRQRESRIVNKDRITVKIQDPVIRVKGNNATVKFRQSYVSDRLNSNSRKTLELTRVDGKWQIKRERVGS